MKNPKDKVEKKNCLGTDNFFFATRTPKQLNIRLYTRKNEYVLLYTSAPNRLWLTYKPLRHMQRQANKHAHLTHLEIW